MRRDRSGALATVLVVAGFVAWLAGVVALGVLGSALDNGWLTLLAVVVLLAGSVGLGVVLDSSGAWSAGRR